MSESPLDKIQTALRPQDGQRALNWAEWPPISSGTPAGVGGQPTGLSKELAGWWEERRKERSGEDGESPYRDLDKEVLEVFAEQRGVVFNAPAKASRETEQGQCQEPGCRNQVKPGERTCCRCRKRASRRRARARRSAEPSAVAA